jgi:DNA-binding ferritin-like protein
MYSQAGDEVTADLFNEITGVLDKDLWLLEAHLQADR